MITEDFVSKEMAKLLAKKGFDVPVYRFYDSQGIPCVSGREDAFNWNEFKDSLCPSYSRPTVQMALKWLREVKHIDIIVNIYCNHHDGSLEYMAEIYRWGGKIVTPLFTGHHGKVIEDAMMYVLEQLDF